MIFLLIASIAYLLGSIPFGFLLVRWFRGEDMPVPVDDALAFFANLVLPGWRGEVAVKIVN